MESPRTRFDLVSRGLGRVAGAVTLFLLGGVLYLFQPSAASGMWLFGVFLLALGVREIIQGRSAAQRSVGCPGCGTRNDVLADAVTFTCYKCGKSLRLPPA
ncbi:MAG: hypothetical protein VKO21_06550 [Candidatus Sericytochromatia bacterium]|nr:hypothetical protein [Candidatus Sericytochromatia bacterium]